MRFTVSLFPLSERMAVTEAHIKREETLGRIPIVGPSKKWTQKNSPPMPSLVDANALTRLKTRFP